jgi:hypothetical protein
MIREKCIAKSAMRILMFASILALLSFSCKDTGVQPTNKAFVLTVDDASCTEVYLSLKIGVGITSRTVTLKRDTITLFTKTISGAETAITDTNLLPSHIYTYTAQLTSGSIASSSTARTMDTTSHSFSWQTFSLGGASSSALYDVAIINDTLAYAVGAIYINDSTGQVDQQPYNLATWDGKVWNIQKIPYYYQGQAFYGPIYSIWAFNTNDIWFAGQIRWDGQRFNSVELPSSAWGAYKVNKMWGTSDANLYIVGDGGSIAHYNGTSWTKIESGTSLDFQDIFGIINPQTNQTEILAVASQLDINQGNKIVSIQGTTVVPINSSGLSWSIVGVWFLPGKQYYIVGDGVGQKHSLQDSNPWTVHPTGTLAANYSESIRGNNINDVIIVGDFGDIVHYNGSTWKSYLSETHLPNGGFGHVAIKGNLVIAVGVNGGKAAITMGRR